MSGQMYRLTLDAGPSRWAYGNGADRQARNVLRFLRIIHALLEDDGIWVNIGECLP